MGFLMQIAASSLSDAPGSLDAHRAAAPLWSSPAVEQPRARLDKAVRAAQVTPPDPLPDGDKKMEMEMGVAMVVSEAATCMLQSPQGSVHITMTGVQSMR